MQMVLRLLFFLLLYTELVGAVHAQSQYDMRWHLSSMDAAEKSVCHNLQLRSASGDVWALESYIVTATYNAAFAGQSSANTLLPAYYEFNDLVSFVFSAGSLHDTGLPYDDEEIGLIRYSGGFLSSQGEPLVIGEQWLDVLNVCFDITADPIEPPDHCLNINFLSEQVQLSIASAGSTLQEDEVTIANGILEKVAITINPIIEPVPIKTNFASADMLLGDLVEQRKKLHAVLNMNPESNPLMNSPTTYVQVFLVKGFAPNGTSNSATVGRATAFEKANSLALARRDAVALRSDQDMANTLVHELGHAVFGLRHPDNDEFFVNDKCNFMFSEGTNRKMFFRHYQIRTVHDIKFEDIVKK